MTEYTLNRNEQGMVHYLYKNDGKHPFVGYCKWESARWMLENDKSRELRMSEEYEGFPLTADGVYFFDGAIEHGAEENGGPEDAATPRSKSFRTEETEAVEPVCGPDWCEIPEVAEKPKRKKRTKDVVCE